MQQLFIENEHNIICIHVVHRMKLKFHDTLLHICTIGIKGIGQMHNLRDISVSDDLSMPINDS